MALPGGGALPSSDPRDHMGTTGARVRTWDGLTKAWELGGGTKRTEDAWQPTPVFLPGESPRTEEPGGLQTMGLQRADTTEQLSSHSTAHQIREKAEPGQ